MSSPNFGELIIDGKANRDAVHIAVAPVIANASFGAGEIVSLTGNRVDGFYEVSGNGEPAVGIIDPFLKAPVKRGEKCWLFLYPKTIIDLHHHWTHPAFDNEKQRSTEWLKDYAERVNPYDGNREAAFANFIKHINEGYIFYHGRDCHNASDVEEPEALFIHLSIYLGRTITIDGFEFSCSC